MYTIFNDQVLQDGSFHAMEFENRIVVESNVLKIKRYQFNLDLGVHEFMSDSDETFTWFKDGVQLPATFINGIYVIDTSEITKININGINYKIIEGTWTTYIPWTPPTIGVQENTDAIQGMLVLMDNFSIRLSEVENI